MHVMTDEGRPSPRSAGPTDSARGAVSSRPAFPVAGVGGVPASVESTSTTVESALTTVECASTTVESTPASVESAPIAGRANT